MSITVTIAFMFHFIYFHCRFAYGNSFSNFQQLLLVENKYDIDKTLQQSPIGPGDFAFAYFLFKRFKNDTTNALLTLLSAPNDSIPEMLLLARMSAKNNSIYRLPENALLRILIKLSDEITIQYIKNNYLFYLPIVLNKKENNEIEDILTTVWSLDHKVVDKFFECVYFNKISPYKVIKHLEFLAKHKEKRAFGILGDIYYYGLTENEFYGDLQSQKQKLKQNSKQNIQIPLERSKMNGKIDIEKALDYYMAGKKLNDIKSYIGCSKIFMSELFKDTTSAFQLLNEAIKIKKTPEALYLRYLLFDNNNNKNAIMDLQMSAMYGYIPAVNVLANFNIKWNQNELAILSFSNIIQFSQYFMREYDEAYEAYLKGDFKMAVMKYLYLVEFDLEIARKNAIYLLKRHKIFKGQSKILFKLFLESSEINKKYFKDVGESYYHGRGVVKDYEMAFGYFLKSSEYSGESLYNVAYMLENGLGVPKNLKLAYSYICKEFSNNDSYLVVFYTRIRIGFKLLIDACLKFKITGKITGAVAILILGTFLYVALLWLLSFYYFLKSKK